MNEKYFERKFILPLISILLGAVMVFFPLGAPVAGTYLSGQSWATMVVALISGYFGLDGWKAQFPAESKNS